MRTRLLLAALIALVLVVLFAPRSSSHQPFAWSPAPWSAAQSVSPSVTWGDAVERRTGAPLDSARVPTAVLGDVRPVGAPPSPAYSTFGPDRLITPSPKAGYPTLVGLASFYRDPTASDDAIYAALPGYRAGTLVNVVVCGYPDGQARCETAPVVTSCGCQGPPRKIIDLSPALFEAVSGMTAAERWTYGVVRVTVQVIR